MKKTVKAEEIQPGDEFRDENGTEFEVLAVTRRAGHVLLNVKGAVVLFSFPKAHRVHLTNR